MDVAAESLPFGQSYWDYLPDLVQDKILKLAHKLVHKQLLKSVHAELSKTCTCLNCNRRFETPFEAEYHWSLYYHPADEER